MLSRGKRAEVEVDRAGGAEDCTWLFPVEQWGRLPAPQPGHSERVIVRGLSPRYSLGFKCKLDDLRQVTPPLWVCFLIHNIGLGWAISVVFNRGDFACQGHFIMSGDDFGCSNVGRACYWFLVGKGHIPYSAQDRVPQQRIIQQYSV